MDVKSPLQVVVVWHPRSPDGASIADHLFRHLCGDPEHPSVRGLGIPVWFRTAASDDEAIPRPIHYGDADRTVVVLLVDDELIAAEGWDRYAEGLQVDAGSGGRRLIPIALSERFANLSPNLSELNFARLDLEGKVGEASAGAAGDPPDALDGSPTQEQPAPVADRVTATVMHELCRFLGGTGVEIQVFISHAKSDGVEIARAVQRHLHENDGLADFFDSTDIPPGTTFSEVINEGVAESSVLLAVLTDSYASRQWCRLEVLEAKRQRVPLIVLAAIQQGEVRSFPYIGNVPVVPWRGPDRLDGLVRVLLREVLRHLWFPIYCDMVAEMAGEIRDCQPFIHPPELLTVLHLRSAGAPPASYYLYPDPPLGGEELRLLAALDGAFEAVTPTQVLSG